VAMTSRSMTCPLPGTPNPAASREPARPASQPASQGRLDQRSHIARTNPKLRGPV
jgi:hypothetical protein